MNLPSQPFDLRRLYGAVDAERDGRGMSWSAVAREAGVATSTIRRFRYADDAEADGVLALVRWFDCAPEDFVAHSSVDGKPVAALTRLSNIQVCGSAVHGFTTQT